MSTPQQPKSNEEKENQQDAAEREASGEAAYYRQYELDAPARAQRAYDHRNALAVKFGFSVEARYQQCLVEQAYIAKLEGRNVLIGESLFAFAALDNEADQANLLRIKASLEAAGRTCEVASCGWLYSALAELAETKNSQYLLGFWMDYHGFSLLSELVKKQPEAERSKENQWFSPMMDLYYRDAMFMLFHDYAEYCWEKKRPGTKEIDANLPAKRSIAMRPTRH